MRPSACTRRSTDPLVAPIIPAENWSSGETSSQQHGRPRCLPTLSGNLCGRFCLRLPHGIYASSTKRNAHLPIPFGMVARERHAGRYPAGPNLPNDFLGALGWADVKRKIPMRPEHEFRIGSITKMFTGLTGAQLEREGLLKTDSVITNYLAKSITDRIANGDRITVKHLLQHRSGIYDFDDNPRWILRYAVLDRRGGWPPTRHLKYVYNKPSRFPPGKRYEYSNSNFILLGLIIDQVTGHSHSIEIRKRFLDPLQLTNTYYELNEPARGERAHGYERLPCFSLDTYDWTPITGGSMGLVSTVSVLAAFVRDVGNRMRLKGSRALAFPAYAEVWDVVWQVADHKTTPLSVASAFFDDVGTSVFFGHAGAVPGYLCFAWRDPKRGITIVWFGSSTLGRDRNASGRFERILEQALFDLTLEQPHCERENSGHAK